MVLRRFLQNLFLVFTGVGTAIFGFTVYIKDPHNVALWGPLAAVSVISFVLLGAMNLNGNQRKRGSIRDL